MVDAVCMGELILDLFPGETGRKLAEVATFLPTPGGAPANVAVQIARLGLKSAFIGKVGDEAFGHHLADVLGQEGVDIRGMRYDTFARTTANFIALPDENSAEFLFYRNPGADMRLAPEELDVELIRRGRAFCFGSLGLVDEQLLSTTHKALETARQAGKLVIFDANYRPTLWNGEAAARSRCLEVLKQVDVLKVNEKELPLLTQPGLPYFEASQALLAQGPRLVVLTLGPQGSFFACTRGSGMVPGFQVTCVDASGCGDSFTGSLIYRLLEGPDWQAHLAPEHLQSILRFANAAGALTATHKGVIPALPTVRQVEAFLAQV